MATTTLRFGSLGGPQTERWFKEQFHELGKMKKRKDGTYYMPSERTKP